MQKHVQKGARFRWQAQQQVCNMSSDDARHPTCRRDETGMRLRASALRPERAPPPRAPAATRGNICGTGGRVIE